jgi:DNA recombination protein RmuC
MSLSLTLTAFFGALIGALITWLALRHRPAAASASLRAERDLLLRRVEAAEAGLREAQAELRRLDSDRASLSTALQKERESFEKALSRSRETFEALAAQALRDSSQSFLDLAKQQLETIATGAAGDLDQRKQAIEALVHPLGETLQQYQEELKTLEVRRSAEQGGLREQIKSLAEMGRRLEQETGSLVNALKAPQVRGRWGEFTLRRVAEMAGMVAHCDFREQTSVNTEEGRLRPDMIVQLPARRQIVVDAKAVLAAYLEAEGAATQEERDRLLDLHAKNVRVRVRELSAKSYWDQFDQSPEFCVLFLPNEAFYSAAMERDPQLFEDAIEEKIVPATPATLIALLHAIAFGWRQEQLSESATKISEAGRELFDRLMTWMEHLEKMGSGLGRAVDAYNRGVSSLQSRVLPSARRIKDLGARTSKEPPELKAIEGHPVTSSLPEGDSGEE